MIKKARIFEIQIGPITSPGEGGKVETVFPESSHYVKGVNIHHNVIGEGGMTFSNVVAADGTTVFSAPSHLVVWARALDEQEAEFAECIPIKRHLELVGNPIDV